MSSQAEMESGSTDSEMPRNPPFARRVSGRRQFAAVLRKNYLLQTRASKSWYSFGAAGWASLAIEIAVPAVFFALMCIPKHFLDPVHFPQQLSMPHDLDNPYWAFTYEGPAKLHEDRALLLYAPNSTAGAALMNAFARSVACPSDPSKKARYSNTFYEFFRQTLPTAECAEQAACLANPACSAHLPGVQIVGYASEEEAVERASQEADTVDAVVALQKLEGEPGGWGYTLRVNHTQVPTTRARLNVLDVRPDEQYKKYWLFSNLQLHLDRAILGSAMDPAGGGPALLEVAIKGFPWPASTFDPGAAAAALAFNLLLVFAFLVPTRSIVSTIVREKELRLREGMRIFGLQEGAYWGSWAISHFSALAASMALCALISLYPFRHSSFTLLLAILWLVAAALIAFAYCLSTLYDKSRVAGISVSMIYSLAMVPGYLMPTFQPYGGWGWYLSCLSPPSALSLFANVLIKVEAGGQGLQWDSLATSVTSESSFPFSARVVMIALIIDLILFSLLAAYLDRVFPSEVGSKLPWNFVFQRAFWRDCGHSRAQASKAGDAPLGWDEDIPGAGGRGPAVAIRGLRKVFRTTDGGLKAAVDGLQLDVERGEITALLGANGAGKTTTISILTGMLEATGGEAYVHGLPVSTQMASIRQNLGVCPQFDILWPDITVREHLELYSAIKGYSRVAAKSAAVSAAQSVGLGEKLEAQAGNLSGGQRRKLSVAIAFLGSPAVVILDEPTSGMDPYSRRFTWEVIKRNRAGHAIILTTHSMEEADLLCDSIAIMAEGRAAAVGTSMDLKQRFGVGYRLTVVKDRDTGEEVGPGAGAEPGEDSKNLAAARSEQSLSDVSESDAAVEELIKQHVPTAQFAGRRASEISFRLPKDASSRFAELLSELEEAKQRLGVKGYGLAETTLEEVFLAVTAQGKAWEGRQPPATAHTATPEDVAIPVSQDATAGAEEAPLLGNVIPADIEGGSEYDGDLRRPTRLQGARLFMQQLWALLVKRAISARRDRLALWTQLAVPILLVLVALISGRSTGTFPQEPALPINRQVCEFGAPSIWGASPEARSNQSALQSFLDSYPGSNLVDSQAEKLWKGPLLMPVDGTLDEYLLKTWHDGRATYDALFFQNWTNDAKVLAAGRSVAYTVLVNQTATHAVPAVLNSVSSALLRIVLGDSSASLPVSNHPLPTLSREAAIAVSRETGDLLLVLFTIMSSALLSASFALFLVRERESCSKAVQMISGTPPSVFWLSTLLWDLLSFSIPAAGILICYAAFNLPQFQGPRLAALALLLWTFGLAALPQTYLLHFAFTDEMKALQRINSLLLLSGYLGFLSTWILDIIYLFTHKSGVKLANDITRRVLRLLFPHFNLARGMYEVASTHHESAEQMEDSPWSWTATGQWVTFFALQAVVFGGLTMAVELGWGDRASHFLGRTVGRCLALIRRRPASQEEQWTEDEDVQRERYRIQDGRGEREGDQVVLSQLEKAYPQGLGLPGVAAVAGVSVGVAQGECFGLLGVNGAGKTTTFKIVTGEVIADSGDASVCGRSVSTHLEAARRLLGYCPQFSALPGAMTGREVLRMYARLRGVPPGLIEGGVDSLLERLDLSQFSDRACESYSGGNKRKLNVAVALMGDPPVVMLDEPSTGMDPGAKRFLWDIIQKQVVDRGHTVLLTSHSMEECEALCTKIGIMRAGRLRCLGSVQHLKNRFGAGYVLQLRIATPGEREAVVEGVRGFCPQAEEVAANSGDCHLTFRMRQEELHLPMLFEKMEELKQQAGVEEYSISQTTLEHVFVQLAQQ